MMQPEKRRELTPAPLLKMVQGAWAAKALAVATELGLFTILEHEGPLSVEETAARLHLHPRPTEMLLTACVALELLKKHDGKYANTARAAAFLVKGKPRYFGDLILHLGVERYEAFARLKQAVLTNQPVARQMADLETDPARAERFTRAMHNNAVGTGAALSRLVDFSSHRCILDLGGGSGGCAIMIVRAHPHLKAVVFDFDPVCRVAQEYIERMGVASRVTTHSGDFWRDEFPEGADVVLLGNIIHIYDEKGNLELLRKVHEYLPSRGRVIIVDFLLNDEKTGPVTSALFALNMLLANEGRTYSGKEVRGILENVGFTDIQTQQSLTGPQGVVHGIKP